MGWRADRAYQEAERAEWRRFMAEQTPGRRLIIRVRQAVGLLSVLILLFSLPVAMTLRSLF